MDGLNMSRRIRRTPYTDRVENMGVRGFSVVNHMLLPKAYATSVEEDYWHLKQAVQIWDVACQRQVQIEGCYDQFPNRILEQQKNFPAFCSVARNCNECL